MPTTLAISFPWGLYHANPWGRHVNEGVVEWPPSPWRLLRALYAIWRTRAPELEDPLVEGTLRALGDPPTYVLPEAVVEAHTRHYLPDSAHGPGGAGKHTDKAIDAFAVLTRGAEMGVRWPAELDSPQRRALLRLAELLPYLGRAESVCEARLLTDGEGVPGSECPPAVADDGSLERATVRLLAPTVPLNLDALVARPVAVRTKDLPEPPGTYWQPYIVPESATPPVTRPARVVQPGRRPTAVRWAVESSARPSLHAALAIAGVLRQACMSLYGSPPSPILAGKDGEGTPLKGHAHAHYLALDDDDDGLVDHLLVWAPAGLGPQETAALAALTRLRGHGHLADFRPTRLGLEAVASVAVAAPRLVSQPPATRWVPHTPFVPPRHPKRRQLWDDHVVVQVREELARRGLPEPATVRPVGGPWLSFRRHRINERLADARRAAGVEVVFPEPVGGPISIGALSHFGLGLFRPQP